MDGPPPLNQDARVQPFFMHLVRHGLKSAYEKYGYCDPLKDGPAPVETPTDSYPIEDGSRTVVIVGAGMAGLSAARELLKEGISVQILEKDTRVGGRLKSFRSANFSDIGVVEAGGMRIPGHMPSQKPVDPKLNVHYLTDYYIDELCKIPTAPFKNKENNAYISLFRKNRQTGDEYERITRTDWNANEEVYSEEYYPGWDDGRTDARLPDEPPYHQDSGNPKYPDLSQGARDYYKNERDINLCGVSSLWTATMDQTREELLEIRREQGPDAMWEAFTVKFGDQEGYDFLRTPHPEVLKDDPANACAWKRYRLRPWSEDAIQGYTDTSYMGPRLEYSLIETLRDEFGPWWGDWMYTIGVGMDELPTRLFNEVAALQKDLPNGKSNFELITSADVYGIQVITEAKCQTECFEHVGEKPPPGDHDNQNELYCEFEIPKDLARVEDITITVEAKDQGFANDPSYSYSWIEVGVAGPNGQEIDHDRRGVVCRTKISSEYSEYTAPKKAIENIVANLQPGNKIQIYLRSRYPAWRCYARKCNVEFSYVPVTFMSGYFEQGTERRVLRVNHLTFNPPLKLGDDGEPLPNQKGEMSGYGTGENQEGDEHKFNIVTGQYIDKDVYFKIEFEEQDAKSDVHAEARSEVFKVLHLSAEDSSMTSALVFKGQVSSDKSSISGQWFESGNLGGKYSGDFKLTLGTSVKLSARVPSSLYLPRKDIPISQKKSLASSSAENQQFYGQKVIITAPLTIFRQFNVNPPLSIKKQQAINSAFYTPSTKVMIEYSRKFWMDENINGGISKTTDVVGQIVYPTTDSPDPAHQVDPDESKKPGILVSYTWQQNAVTLGGLPPEERAVVVRRCINRMHPGTNAAGEKVHEGAEHYFLGNIVSGDGDKKPHYHAEVWHNDDHAQGAILHWTAHQYSNYYKAIMDPEYSCLYIAGEGASWANAWVQGAVQSGLRAAYMIFCQFQAEKKRIVAGAKAALKA